MTLSRSVLRMRKVPNEFVEKIKTHVFWSNFFVFEIRAIWDNVEKYGRARQVTGDNIIKRARFACRITKAPDRHSEQVTLIAFHGNVS